MYQNAGEKEQKHADPDDPPRRRANKVKGHGAWDNDCPPVAGTATFQLGPDFKSIGPLCSGR